MVAPDRGVTATATVQAEADGAVPGSRRLAGSLDPRLTSLLLPFPHEPVGVGRRVDRHRAAAGLRRHRRPGRPRSSSSSAVEDRYILAAAIAMVTPTPEDGLDLRLRGPRPADG